MKAGDTELLFTPDRLVPPRLHGLGTPLGLVDMCYYYSASAFIAMQTAVLRAVCLSVTFRCFVQMNEHTIVRFSASGRTILLVSGEVKSLRIFIGDYPQQGR